MMFVIMATALSYRTKLSLSLCERVTRASRRTPKDRRWCFFGSGDCAAAQTSRRILGNLKDPEVDSSAGPVAWSRLVNSLVRYSNGELLYYDMLVEASGTR